MIVQSPSQTPSWTRRETISRAGALGTGVLIGIGYFKGSAAHGTPTASPVPEHGYARPEILVDVDWLTERLGEAGTVVVAFMPEENAERARIPGALAIDWPELEVIDTSDASIASWQEHVERLIGDLGIDQDSTVVIYDDGTLFAARLWWILHYLGHERAHVLNGGLAAWQEAGLEVETGPIYRTQVVRPPYEGEPNGAVLAQMDEVLAALDDPGTVTVDSRTPEEYADGHIPGAVNVNYPRNAEPEPPKRWKPANELLSMYEEVGVTPEHRVIPYCSTGVRSAVTFFTLHLLGFEAALYTGSWEEWGSHPDTPKETDG